MSAVSDAVERRLSGFFSYYKHKYGCLPRFVKRQDFLIPNVEGAVGEFGCWNYEKSDNCPPISVFSKFYCEPFPQDLYDYISCWRFIEFDFLFGNYNCTLGPVYENNKREVNVPLTTIINNRIFYKIGIATHVQSRIIYYIVYGENKVFIMDGETFSLKLLSDSLLTFLENGEDLDA